MKAAELFRRRISFSESAVAELVLWQLPARLPGSTHPYKYRLAYVVDGLGVLRYDNEAGQLEFPYVAIKVEFLLQAA